MGLTAISLRYDQTHSEAEDKKRIWAENDSLNRTEEERVAEESPENAERTYTQAEVNEIIRERLRRERAPTPEEAQTADLAARELELQQKLWLNDNNLPVDAIMKFFDEMDLGSMEGFECTIDNLRWICDVIIENNREVQRRLEAKSQTSGQKSGEKKDLLGQIFEMGGRF